MSDLESALRETLAGHATEAPAGDDVLAVVRRRGGAQRTRRRVLAAGTALALGTSGVVAVAASDLNPFVADDVVVTEPDPVDDAQIACYPGGTPFDPDLLSERPPIDPEADLGIPVGTTARPQVARRLIESWSLLGRHGSTVDLLIWLVPGTEGTNVAERGMVAVTYEQADDGTWSFRSSGGCDPQRVFHDGLNSATWALPGAAPGPEATSVTILVTEFGCASGQSADGRVAEPIVEYTEDAVLITTRVDPPVGNSFTCPGPPPTEVTVELDQPLGDRDLLDGMWFPAKPVLENTGG